MARIALKKKQAYVVAVVGATGAVGNEMIDLLEEREFPVERLKLFASERSEGESLSFEGSDIFVETLSEDSFDGVDIALFSAGSERSKQWAPVALKAGCVVIDTSSRWRMNSEVPLVVPEVNLQDLNGHKGLIASPDCTAIQIVMALKPIHDAARIKRVVVTTLQAVSDTGKKAMDELFRQTVDLLNFKEVSREVYPHQIAFNLIPGIDSFLENGYTKEEMKMAEETRKIMGDNSIMVTATAVRVPVFRSHSAAVNIETERGISAQEVRELLSLAPGVKVFDAPEKDIYPLPLDAAGRDEVYVGRIRDDESLDKGINIWVVADNLRKGAALNVVQIAEELVKAAV